MLGDKNGLRFEPRPAAEANGGQETEERGCPRLQGPGGGRPGRY